MDTLADDIRPRPQQVIFTSLKLFFINLIEGYGLKRTLAGCDKSKQCILMVLTANTIELVSEKLNSGRLVKCLSSASLP